MHTYKSAEIPMDINMLYIVYAFKQSISHPIPEMPEPTTTVSTFFIFEFFFVPNNDPAAILFDFFLPKKSSQGLYACHESIVYDNDVHLNGIII
jgi:hypothetical protein